MNKRNHFIDILKGVCIIFVVISHFSWTDEEIHKYLFPFWIDMAIPIFMIISGYVYSLSYRKNQIDSIGEAYLLRNTMNKMIRYTVPFFIAFLIEEFYIEHTSLSIYQTSSIFSRFLTGGYGPGSYYYPVMMQFIFVFPIIYFIVEKYHFRGVVICGLINALFELLQREYEIGEKCYRLLMFRYVLLIAAGCFTALYGDLKNKKILKCISCIVGTLFIIAYCYLGYVPQMIIYWTNTSFIACLYIIPIACYMICKFLNAKCSFLEIIGKCSYNIFLTQMLWYAFGSGSIGTIIDDRCLQLIINLVICLLGGVIFHYFETPITKRIIVLAYGVLDKYMR